MKVFPLLTTVLIVARQVVSLPSCTEQTSCESCVTEVSSLSSEGCRWCLKDNRCYDYGSKENPSPSTSNPCNTAEYLYNNVTNWSVLCKIPLPSQHKYEYDPELSKIALAASSAAYTRSPECLEITLPKMKFNVIQKFKIECFNFYISQDSCFAYIAISHIDKMIVVAFRGSKNFHQITAQFFTFFYSKKEFIEGGRVQPYYKNGFDQFWSAGLETEINRTRSNYPDYKFLVTGHSLGGALASLASLSMVYYGLVPSTQLFLYTFGMPKAGDEQYAVLHERYVINSMRVVNTGDLISLLPPPIGRRSKPGHHATEIILDSVENQEELNEYDRLPEWWKTKAHTVYMGIYIGTDCKSHVL